METGSDFGVNLSVTHNSLHPQDAHDAHNLVIFLEYPEQFVLPPSNFTLFYSNGTSELFGRLKSTPSLTFITACSQILQLLE